MFKMFSVWNQNTEQYVDGKEVIQRAYDLLRVGEVAAAIERSGYEFGAVIEDGHLKGFERN